MKLALVISALAVALTGCGGGGGGSSTTSSGSTAVTTNASISSMNVGSSSHPFIPSLVTGDFKGDGSTYVVLSGWLVGTTVPSVKVYRLTATGATDATTDILGADFSLSVNYPQVADFNRDGIDDIFFAGFTDDIGSSQSNQSVAFMSRSGQSHLRVDVAGLTWSHGSTVIDLNNDGWPDVANQYGDFWINNQANGFTYMANYSSWAGSQAFHGSGLCSGDLDSSGTTSIVVVDVSTATAFKDTWIYKLDSNLQSYKVAELPIPYFERSNTTTASRSHDVSCVVGDLNSDGRLDVVVVSYLHDNSVTNTAGPQSQVQVYMNQGNLVFTETTDTAFVGGYNQSTLASYTPKLIDLNGDGKLDLWLMNTNSTVSSGGTAESANQAWINSGTGTFTQAKRSHLNTVVQAYNLLSGSNSNTAGIMIPVKIAGAWNFAISNSWSNGAATITYFGYAKSQLTF
jgi:FG-GAP-like repeat